MFLNFTHPPPPSKQCEKGKESSYWVGRFKTHNECLFGQKNNYVNGFGTEWNWNCLLDLIQLETLPCFSVLQPSGIFCLPTDSAFPIWLLSGVQDGWWGFLISPRLQHKHLPAGPGLPVTSALGGWGCSGPSLTLATSPHVTANQLVKVLKQICSRLCPVLIKWEIELNESGKMVSRQSEEIPRK